MEVKIEKQATRIHRYQDSQDNNDFCQIVKIEEPQESHSQQNYRNTKGKKWSNKHKFRYLIFLKKYQEQIQGLENRPKRIKTIFYELMSTYIGKLKILCQIYHKKQLIKYKSVDGIITYLHDIVEYEQQNIDNQYQRLSQILEERRKQSIKALKLNNHESKSHQKFSAINAQFIEQNVHKKIQEQLVQKIRQKLFTQKKQCLFQMHIEVLLVFERQVQHDSKISQQQIKVVTQIIQKFKKSIPNPIKTSELKDKIIAGQPQISEEQDSRNFKKGFQKSSEIKAKIQNQIKKQYLIYKQDTKEKKHQMWTNQQTTRLIVFMNVNKQIFLSSQRIRKKKIYEKCSQYFNSQKTPLVCRKKITNLFSRYQKDVNKMIEQETKRFLISAEMIQIAKKEYLNLPQKQQICNIKVKYSPVKIEMPSDQNLRDFLRDRQKQISSEIDILVDFYESQKIKKILKKKKTQSVIDQVQPCQGQSHKHQQIQIFHLPQRKLLVKLQCSNFFFIRMFRALKNKKSNLLAKNQLKYRSDRFLMIQKSTCSNIIFIQEKKLNN